MSHILKTAVTFVYMWKDGIFGLFTRKDRFGLLRAWRERSRTRTYVKFDGFGVILLKYGQFNLALAALGSMRYSRAYKREALSPYQSLYISKRYKEIHISNDHELGGVSELFGKAVSAVISDVLSIPWFNA